MTRTFILPTAITVLLTGAAFAVEPTLGAKLGTNIEDISAAVAADGYEMTKFEKEGTRIEIYAVKDGTRHEVDIDAATGEVLKVEMSARGGPSPLPGMNDDDIRAALKGQGYDVTKYERERGQVEVYANKDGRRWELKVDPKTGKIMSVEAED
ncbi:PepSY domain-containing protein [Litoreibacter halocynthiae]|uniref:PepSY domain-containing protein n=1 Tax=Litoreibacter halocynthiae TaxID=1242689 RepID=UPI002492AF77|nr:PepSY domain-containing protein [Litoreibacter halocynthiae]